MAIRAIGLAGGIPSPAEVAGEFSAIQISKTLYGASGPIQLSGVYTGKHPQGSNPVGQGGPDPGADDGRADPVPAPRAGRGHPAWKLATIEAIALS
jgi:hypothetical protein